MEGNYRQKSMYLAFIPTSFILDAWLYFYMHVSCFHSYSSLFFILVCMLTRLSRYVFSIISYSCFILISFLFFVTIFLNSGMLCFVFIAVIPTSCIFIATGYQSTNTKHEAESIKTNTSCMNLVLYYDVRRHYNRSNCCSR